MLSSGLYQIMRSRTLIDSAEPYRSRRRRGDCWGGVPIGTTTAWLWGKGSRMTHAAKLAVVTILFAGISQTVAASQAEKRGAQKTEQQKKKPEGTSLTGCVDEQEGQYVLVDDHDPGKVIASLVAEGFPTEGFAKHVGQKVTVRGVDRKSVV